MLRFRRWLAEITAEDEEMKALSGVYSAKKAKDLKAFAFDRRSMEDAA